MCRRNQQSGCNVFSQYSPIFLGLCLHGEAAMFVGLFLHREAAMCRHNRQSGCTVSFQ